MNTLQFNMVCESIDYIKRMYLSPYIYGGKGFHGDHMELDCSQLAVEFLRSLGVIGDREDYTAEQLRQMFEPVIDPDRGYLVMFGKDKAVHVGIMVNQSQMIEAGYGDSQTRTIKDAVKKQAYVCLRNINRRSDFLCFVNPFERRVL